LDCALAIDLGGTAIKGGLITANGAILARLEAPTGTDFRPDYVADRISEVAISLRQDAVKKKLVPIGLGLGSPGGIYEDRRTISQSPNFPGWKDIDLVTLIEKNVELPVCMENDANAAALGEFWIGQGATEGVSDLVLYTLGTGVGGGIVIKGKVWHGSFGMAGELGHVCVEPDGRLCGCGSRGCLEQYASGPGIVKTALEFAKELGIALSSHKQITPLVVAEAARSRNKAAKKAFDSAGMYLGRGMSAVLNILNPPLFLVGGGVSLSFDLMEKAVLKEISARAFAYPAAKVKVKRAALINDAGLLGVAKLAFDLFSK